MKCAALALVTAVITGLGPMDHKASSIQADALTAAAICFVDPSPLVQQIPADWMRWGCDAEYQVLPSAVRAELAHGEDVV